MIRMRESFYPFAALTDPGLLRTKNEDRFGITAFRSEGNPSMPGLLAVLCDGVGGESAGEVAAEVAVNSITQHALLSASDDPSIVLPEAVKDANEVIHARVRDNPGLSGMAATAAIAWISGRRLNIATLGDSRIYLIRGDTITQLSTDHTWVQEALETGKITEEESENHPNAHVIRRFLGSNESPALDMSINLPGGGCGDSIQLQPWDVVFLCSDGCSDLVSPEEILERLEDEKLEKGLEAIKKLAFQRGGRDNITMLAVEIPKKVPGAPQRKRILRWVLAGMAVAFAVALGLYVGWWFQNYRIDPTLVAFTPQRFASTLAPIVQTPVPSLTPTLTFTSTAVFTPTVVVSPTIAPDPFDYG